jgi:hypothetical protein
LIPQDNKEIQALEFGKTIISIKLRVSHIGLLGLQPGSYADDILKREMLQYVIMLFFIKSLRPIPFLSDIILPPWLNRSFRLGRHKLSRPDTPVIDLRQVLGKFGTA